MPLAEVTRARIVDGRERRQKTPSQANNFLNTMRALFAWARDAELVEIDPTADVKNVKRPTTGGFHVWTEEEVERFETRLAYRNAGAPRVRSPALYRLSPR